MLIEGSGSRKVGANSSNKDVFFTLYFYLINFHLLGAGVYGDN